MAETESVNARVELVKKNKKERMSAVYQYLDSTTWWKITGPVLREERALLVPSELRLTVDSLPSSRFCVSLRSSSRPVWRLPVGTSLAEDVSDDSSMEESVDSAESVTSFPRRWEQSERTSQ